ncbi:MAG: hypothetical protein RMM06_10280 [Armatimonadota bacterium]|nr:hypothetical protein [Armatimonadota bacterium]
MCTRLLRRAMLVVLLERSMLVVAHVSAPPVILSAEQEIAGRTSVRFTAG